MRIRFTVTLDIERAKADLSSADTFESSGSLVEMSPQPRYVGFEALED